MTILNRLMHYKHNELHGTEELSTQYPGLVIVAARLQLASCGTGRGPTPDTPSPPPFYARCPMLLYHLHQRLPVHAKALG